MSRPKKPSAEPSQTATKPADSRAEVPAASTPAPPPATATPATATPATTTPATATPATATATAAEPAATPPPRPLSKLILENTQFLSSVVIGGAGLIATSLYQWNNSKLAQRQAEWQQQREMDKAKNDWRIERAKILAQNLATLTARGGDTAEQRFGVLLSLTRGNILDPDLAVSYALELGKDSPEYMRSVLTNVDGKDLQHYQRLAGAYLPTCFQRYGVSVPSLPVCKDDALHERSRAIAEVVADDLEVALAEPKANRGPLGLLVDEREVNNNLLRLTGLFSEFVGEIYDRRQWPTLDRFLNHSPGARLVGTFSLLTLEADPVSTGSNDTTRPRLDAGRAWLESYMTGSSCDSECRSRMVSIVLSNFGRGQGHFPRILRSLLEKPRNESTPFLNRLHSRLSLCQFDPDDAVRLRDEVILPVLRLHAEKPTPDSALVDDLLNQMMLLPLPAEGAADWKALQATLLRVTKGRQPKLFLDSYAEEQRRKKMLAALAQATPQGPPWSATKAPTTAAPAIHKHKDFCSVISQLKSQSDDQDE